MRVTKWGEYGILCALYLARKEALGEAVGASEIADAHQIPIQYTQQILQRLRKGGIIKSVRGPHGGYALSLPPEATTLKNILYAAEGDTFELICEESPAFDSGCGSNSNCGLKTVWVDLKKAINELLDQRTLASLLKTHIFGTASGESVLVSGPKASECRVITSESITAPAVGIKHTSQET